LPFSAPMPAAFWTARVYRCATALLLHADAAHIAGNMAGMGLFGGAVCVVTGSGVGWLMILASGIFGNLMNALAYETGHMSVGASTAVFGAVGILCAFQAVNAAKTGKGWKRTALAFGSGVALLAFLGNQCPKRRGGSPVRVFLRRADGGRLSVVDEAPLGMKGQVLCGIISASTHTAILDPGGDELAFTQPQLIQSGLQRVRGEAFNACFGDQQRLFKLGREGSVLGHRRPSVVKDNQFFFAQVNHGFDGEHHAGYQTHT
jgi:hypothetical protein